MRSIPKLNDIWQKAEQKRHASALFSQPLKKGPKPKKDSTLLLQDIINTLLEDKQGIEFSHDENGDLIIDYKGKKVNLSLLLETCPDFDQIALTQAQADQYAQSGVMIWAEREDQADSVPDEAYFREKEHEYDLPNALYHGEKFAINVYTTGYFTKINTFLRSYGRNQRAFGGKLTNYCAREVLLTLVFANSGIKKLPNKKFIMRKVETDLTPRFHSKAPRNTIFVKLLSSPPRTYEYTSQDLKGNPQTETIDLDQLGEDEKYASIVPTLKAKLEREPTDDEILAEFFEKRFSNIFLVREERVSQEVMERLQALNGKVAVQIKRVDDSKNPEEDSVEWGEILVYKNPSQGLVYWYKDTVIDKGNPILKVIRKEMSEAEYQGIISRLQLDAKVISEDQILQEIFQEKLKLDSEMPYLLRRFPVARNTSMAEEKQAAIALRERGFYSTAVPGHLDPRNICVITSPEFFKRVDAFSAHPKEQELLSLCDQEFIYDSNGAPSSKDDFEEPTLYFSAYAVRTIGSSMHAYFLKSCEKILRKLNSVFSPLPKNQKNSAIQACISLALNDILDGSASDLHDRMIEIAGMLKRYQKAEASTSPLNLPQIILSIEKQIEIYTQVEKERPVMAEKEEKEEKEKNDEKEQKKTENFSLEEIHSWLFENKKDSRFPRSKLESREQEKHQPQIEAKKCSPMGEGNYSRQMRIYQGSLTDIRIEDGKRGAIATSNNGDLFTGCGYAIASAVIHAAGAGLQQELYNRYGVSKTRGKSQYGGARYHATEGCGYAIACQSYDMKVSHNIDQIEFLTVPSLSEEGVVNMYYEAFMDSQNLDYIILPMAGATHRVIGNNAAKSAELAMEAFFKFRSAYPRSKLVVIFSLLEDEAVDAYRQCALELDKKPLPPLAEVTEPLVRQEEIKLEEKCLTTLNLGPGPKTEEVVSPQPEIPAPVAEPPSIDSVQEIAQVEEVKNQPVVSYKWGIASGASVAVGANATAWAAGFAAISASAIALFAGPALATVGILCGAALSGGMYRKIHSETDVKRRENVQQITHSRSKYGWILGGVLMLAGGALIAATLGAAIVPGFLLLMSGATVMSSSYGIAAASAYDTHEKQEKSQAEKAPSSPPPVVRDKENSFPRLVQETQSPLAPRNGLATGSSPRMLGGTPTILAGQDSTKGLPRQGHEICHF